MERSAFILLFLQLLLTLWVLTRTRRWTIAAESGNFGSHYQVVSRVAFVGEWGVRMFFMKKKAGSARDRYTRGTIDVQVVGTQAMYELHWAWPDFIPHSPDQLSSRSEL